MTIWTAGFWKALAERVIATFLMTFVALVTVDGFDFQHADWKGILIASAIAAGLSVAKGLIANLATKNGPSVTNSEQVFPPEPQPIGQPEPQPIAPE
jgi:glycerol uptake facilitator-like aquaporin